MPDKPTTGGDNVEDLNAFRKAQQQRRRDAKEKRKLENEAKLGPGDATRQFACEMRADGLHLLKDGVAIWIAQLFEIIGIGRSPIENGVSDTRGIAISFTNRRGQYREVFINGDLLNGDLGRLFSLLYLAGFKFDRHDVYRRALQRYLAGYSTTDSAIIAESTGLIFDSGKFIGFLFPHEFIPAKPDLGRVILDPTARLARFAQSGTLEQAQEHVCPLALQHTHVVFRMCAALVGPLLGLTGQEAIQAHNYGISSGGKTTCDRFALSLWGSPSRRKGFGQTWLITANGAEASLASHSHIVLFVDDTSHAEARDILKVIYMVSSDQGKTRMRQDTSGREAVSFCTPLLSTGEEPITVTLREAKIKVKGGITVRVLDIPAIGRGKFNSAEPGALFDASDPDWRAFVRKSVRATKLYHGTLGPEFVRRFVASGIDGDEINALVDEFIQKKLELSNPGGQLHRAAMKCGLIATAGELAIKLGVLPWPPGTAINAAIYVFGLWRRQRGTDGSYELQEALERIQSLFERSSNSRFDLTGPNADLGSERPAPNRLGWTEGGGDDQQWYILPATWKKEICGGLDPKVLNSELKKLGALILGVERDGDRLRWRPKYVTIRGKQTRCYIVTTKIFEVVLRPSEEGFDD